MHGVLIVDKPAGMTSAEVVRRAKRELRVRKIGHTGTLDPMATGVLPLVVGNGTKIAQFLLADDKAYLATIVLGVATDTLDADGEVVADDRERAAALTREMVADAMRPLRGEIDQVPPMYSALKRDGVPLYKRARAGETIERAPRRVRVDRFELARCQPPEIDVVIECSKGTYVRALARDLGAALNVGAHLSRLRRTRAGRFDIASALSLDDLSRESPVVSLADALDHLPAIHPSLEHLKRIAHGLPRRAAELAPGFADGQRFCCLTPSGTLAAIAFIAGDEVRYERVFPAAITS